MTVLDRKVCQVHSLPLLFITLFYLYTLNKNKNHHVNGIPIYKLNAIATSFSKFKNNYYLYVLSYHNHKVEIYPGVIVIIMIPYHLN